MAKSVKNLEIDIINYGAEKDFQVLAEFVDNTHCNVIIKRLDTTNENNGWNESPEVFLHDFTGNTKTIDVGASDKSTKIINVTLPENFKLIESDKHIADLWHTSYNPLPHHHIYRVTRDQFNEKFDTDIVELPSSMFAFGIKDGVPLKYHDSYGMYTWEYEIELTINHIISVAYSMSPRPPNFYAVICALDGYLENYYPSNRDTPRPTLTNEFRSKVTIDLKPEEANMYPLLHKQKYILGQSVHPDTKYAIAVPDRYYFCLHRYNLYRSIHRGIPFKNKIPKIVYACNPRGTKYNFTKRRDIDMSQRVYFKSDAIAKENIYTAEYIDRSEMINYKYILDIDGNASTWDATAWKLNSGSVILKCESNWVQWFYDDYKPWVNYIPIADDFSDLQEKFLWCETHQPECEVLTARNKELFQKIYRIQNVIKYTESVIDKLNDIRDARI